MRKPLLPGEGAHAGRLLLPEMPGDTPPQGAGARRQARGTNPPAIQPVLAILPREMKLHQITRVTELIDGNGQGESREVNILTHDLEQTRAEIEQQARAENPLCTGVLLIYRTIASNL